MLSPLYMAEISPPEVRGSLLALEQLSIVLGVVFGFWTGFITRSIPGPMSWRIPLGVQIIPGIILGLGCLILPPSPRWLVLKGRDADALKSLARLRMRTQEEAESDSLLQIELLEMKVETELIQKTFAMDGDKSGFKLELKAWGRLFSKEYRDRTLVGVLIMFFQRALLSLSMFSPTTSAHEDDRVEWHQRTAVLWPNAGSKYRTRRRYGVASRVWRYRNRSVLRRHPSHCIYRQNRCVPSSLF